jgi:hypothetical protein
MDAILQAIAHLIDDWGWLLLFAMLCGGGDVIGRALSGRRANQRLRGELKATKAALKHLRAQAPDARALESGAASGDVAALAKQLRAALDDRTRALELLSRVEATDQAWPQLPKSLRTDIDAALAQLRTRSASSAD